MTEYSDTLEIQECATYLQNTWLKLGRAESIVQAWTNKHPHFGVTVTSRLVSISSISRLFQDYFRAISGLFHQSEHFHSLLIPRLMINRVESSHALLKQYITSSQSDLLTVRLQIEQAISNQIQNIKAIAAKDRIQTPLHLS